MAMWSKDVKPNRRYTHTVRVYSRARLKFLRHKINPETRRGYSRETSCNLNS